MTTRRRKTKFADLQLHAQLALIDDVAREHEAALAHLDKMRRLCFRVATSSEER